MEEAAYLVTRRASFPTTGADPRSTRRRPRPQLIFLLLIGGFLALASLLAGDPLLLGVAVAFLLGQVYFPRQATPGLLWCVPFALIMIASSRCPFRFWRPLSRSEPRSPPTSDGPRRSRRLEMARKALTAAAIIVLVGLVFPRNALAIPGDADGNGVVDLGDARIIARFLVNQIPAIPPSRPARNENCC